MKTRTVILLMTLLISGGIAKAGEAYSKLVEPGRTWWYWSWTSYSQGQEKVILGLTLDRPDSEGWTPCYALDSLNQKVVEAPLCILKEENGRVNVRPNLHIPEIDYKDRTNEQRILSTFLGYWYGEYLGFTTWNGGEPLSWNPVGESEFLLYDFNYVVGDSYAWPWSGVGMEFKPYTQRNIYLEDYTEVASIAEESIPVGIGMERDAKTFILKQYQRNSAGISACPGNIRLIEGLGITAGGSVRGGGYGNSVESYAEDMITWCGFFIAPMSICLADLSGSMANPTIPDLHSVIDSDGTCLYMDPEFLRYSGIEKEVAIPVRPEENLPLYDLHGRRVSNPLPGSVYVKGGKKYVER